MPKKGKKTARPVQGIVFPENIKGKRSSTAAVKKILAASVADINPVLAQKILDEKKWRKKYPGYINRINAVGIKSSKACLTIAQKGLDEAYQTLCFVRKETEMSINRAMETFTDVKFFTAVINGGRPPKGSPCFSLPYKNRTLSQDSLIRQTDAWEQNGIFEPSFARSLKNVAHHKTWSNLSGRTFVLLGAGSEIAPFKTLLDLGATVVAVDLPRPAIWERLIRIARQSAGKLIMPIKKTFDPTLSDEQLAALAGSDLACDAPEIRTWLLGMKRPMTIGAYAYADGAVHVRIAMAMDAIIKNITAKRDDINIAFYLTPSDSYAVPKSVVEASRSKRQNQTYLSFFYSVARFLSFGKMFTPHNDTLIKTDKNKTYGLSDNMIIQQGPGYILAKNIQKWRGLTARDKGIRVSGNVAPATTPRSVFKNWLLAAGYAGLAHFKAEAFKSETTGAMMAAALICDLNDKSSAANPETVLSHPFELFMKNANHGGLWRVTFKPRSVLAFSVCLGAFKALKGKFSSGNASFDPEPVRTHKMTVKAKSRVIRS